MKKQIKAAILTALTLSFAAAAPAMAAEQPTGWLQNENGWYLQAADGTCLTGWQQKDGLWYYMKPDGVMQTGWLLDGDTWYYLEESGKMATGWRHIGGKYYYLSESGAMLNGVLLQDETEYLFQPSGELNLAKKKKNTGGGAYTLDFYDEPCRNLADNLNEVKLEAFDGDEADDYYADELKNYDKDASYVMNGRLIEIAEHRLEMARTRGYGNGRIPDEGTISDYLKSIRYESGRRVMEVYLMNCDGADEAEYRLLRKHGSDQKKRADRAVSYSQMGIAHQEANGRDYYMVILMR